MKHIKPKIKFFINAILSRGKVGAITMSSDYVVEGVIKRIKGPLKTVVEYGPGDGVMTKAILKLISPDGSLIVIESDPRFAKSIRKINDPRILVIEGTIQQALDSELRDINGVDLVLSSIPFSMLKPSERDEVIAQTYAILATDGLCVIFHQYSTLIKKTLKKYFKTVVTSFEPRNIFPCFILFAKKS